MAEKQADPHDRGPEHGKRQRCRNMRGARFGVLGSRIGETDDSEPIPSSRAEKCHPARQDQCCIELHGLGPDLEGKAALDLVPVPPDRTCQFTRIRACWGQRLGYSAPHHISVVWGAADGDPSPIRGYDIQSWRPSFTYACGHVIWYALPWPGLSGVGSARSGLLLVSSSRSSIACSARGGHGPRRLLGQALHPRACWSLPLPRRSRSRRCSIHSLSLALARRRTRPAEARVKFAGPCC